RRISTRGSSEILRCAQNDNTVRLATPTHRASRLRRRFLMALTPSTMPPLGTAAPDFRLPDTEGKTVSLGDFAGSPALLVAFICNHCPYVKHILDHFTEFARAYQARGLQVVAISSNDPREFPEDDFEHMRL